MAIDPKRILRPADIYGLLSAKENVEVEGTTGIKGKLTATGGTDSSQPLNIRFDASTDPAADGSIITVINDLVTITAKDPTADTTVFKVDGLIENRQFFPLNLFIPGTDVVVKPNEGIIVPPIGTNEEGNRTRYYINRFNVNQTVTDTTDFEVLTASGIFGEWFADESACTVDHHFTTTSRTWNNSDGTSGSGPERFWNEINGGVTWTTTSTDPEITALCMNVLETPLLIKNTGAPNIELVKTELIDPEGIIVDVTSDIVTPADPTHPITLTYPIAIPNTLNTDPINRVWTFKSEFRDVDSGDTVSGIEAKVTYLEPRAALSSIITSPSATPIFDELYVQAVITRTFAAGNPTLTNLTEFGGVMLSAGTSNLSFALNRGSLLSASLFREITEYRNPFNTLNLITLTREVNIKPTFTFPFYLGNVTTIVGFDNAAATIIVEQGGTIVSNLQNQFNWPDVGNDQASTKIFGIRTSALGADPANRELRFKANQAAGFGIENKRFTSLDIGRIAGTEENYSFFIAQLDQPGPTSLYVEFV